jgi:tetratricopeptide (TPR) repeat protein
MFKKWLLLWNATEIGDTESQYAFYQWSFLLRIMGNLFHFGVLCPLAVTGIWLTWDLRRRLWLLYLILFGYAASITLFYIFARYRVPMIPVLILFAAAGIPEGISLLRRKQIASILVCTGIVAISAIVVNRKEIPSAYFAATNYSNLASCLERSYPGKALEYYRQAVRLNPLFVKGYFRLGCFLMRQGDPGGAVASYTRGLMVNPDNDLMHYHTGLAYIEMHRPDSALFHFRQVVRINPGFDPVVFYKMAVAQAMMHNREDAVARLEQAVKNGFTDKPVLMSEKTIDEETKELFLRIVEENSHSTGNCQNATSKQE